MTKRVPMIAAILASATLTVQAGEMTLYESAGFGGRNVTLRAYTPNIGEVGFNDRASSLVVLSGRWEVCTEAGFGGYCTTLAPGEYRTLDGRFNNRISSAREAGTTPGDADDYGTYANYGRGSIELFGKAEFGGKSIRLDRDTVDLKGSGFEDRASSVVVHEGSWELCSDAAFGGTCRIYTPGRYDELGHGMAKEVSSARLVRSRHVAPFVHGISGGSFTASQARARVILYEGDGFRGRSMAISDSVFDLRRSGFGDETQSAVVEGGNWLFCADPNFRGPCRVMAPGQYPRLDPALQYSMASLRPTGSDGNAAIPPAPAEGGIELFADSDFGGRRLAVRSDVRNLRERDFDRQAGSLTIWHGHWEVCTEVEYGGRCAVFEPGRYANLYGLNDKISSIHQVY